jgi:molecular chaperone DnaK
VTFDIDANGIVQVSAKDKATGKEQQIRIQASGGLSDAEIDKMVKDAEANASEDKKRREAIEARNSADALIHTTEKSLSEHGAKISAAEKADIESALADAKASLDSGDAADIKAKTDALAKASMKLGEAMYREQSEGGSSDGDAGAGPSADAGAGASAQPDSTVVDADFEEVDERKKGRSA